MTNATRKAGAAGSMRAGEPFAEGDNLLGLLDFSTVAEGVRIGDHLRERLAANETATAAHAAGADDAALAGDDAEREHAERAARLDREARRFRLAIERADERLTEVADAERKAGARAKVKAAAKAAVRAEEIVGNAYPEAASTVAALLDELAGLQRQVTDAWQAAQDAGIGDEAADLILPHERRSRPEVTEDRVIETRSRPVGVYTATGRRLDGNGHADEIVERRTERVVVQSRIIARNIATARALLPDPDGGAIVDRGAD